MVQFRRNDTTERTGANYWQIIDYSRAGLQKARLVDMLKTRGVQAQVKFKKDRLVELFDRQQLGLYDYQRCSKDELSTFCTQRGVTLPAGNPTKAAIVERLEQADKTATFDKFEALPAELRVIIYEMHFRWLGPRAAHSQRYTQDPIVPYFNPPPITQVSNLLRREALPLFYSAHFFGLALPSYNASNLTSLINAAPEEAFGYIRTLYLSGDWFDFLLRIEHPVGGKEIEFHLERYERLSQSWPGRPTLEWRLDHLMKGIKDRAAGGKGKLQKADVTKILSFFPSD